MTATLSTIVVRDATGAEYSVRVLDISGVGSGPFAMMHGLLGPAGAPIDGSNPLPTTNKATPGRKARKLVAANLSDTVDLATEIRAFRISNQSTNWVTLLVTPADVTSDAAADAVPITVPLGGVGYEPLSIRRIWSTGSTGLAAGLAAGTVEVVLITD